MKEHSKIKSLKELSRFAAHLKNSGKKIVHCHGCFDLIHIGHIRYFQQAKQMGDILIVTVTPDKYVDKGHHRPAFPENLRMEAEASLDCVDFVALNAWPTAEETFRLLKPDVYVKGSYFKGAESDSTGKLAAEAQVADKIGTEVAFTKDIVFSSTNLINRFFSAFSQEIHEYLTVFKTRYDMDDVFDILDRMSTLKALVIGEAIIDDYHFCSTLGISSKDHIPAVLYDSHDMFAGGALAVANHVAHFVDEVRLCTVLGGVESYEGFIRSKLEHNVKPFFIVREGAPTIVKRRFLEGYSLNKLFEVYVMDDTGLSLDIEEGLCGFLRREIPQYDLVIAADYGHGTISDRVRHMLIEESPFLAVNTQANSGNRGFHTISRYPHADYVCIADHELRLELREKKGEMIPMVNDLAVRMNCSNFVVTRGKKGCIARSGDGRFVEVPAFAQKVIDRVGAGDTFLAVTSPAAKLDVHPELIGFIGNVAGALAVEIIGNQRYIDKPGVQKFVASLLK